MLTGRWVLDAKQSPDLATPHREWLEFDILHITLCANEHLQLAHATARSCDTLNIDGCGSVSVPARDKTQGDLLPKSEALSVEKA